MKVDPFEPPPEIDPEDAEPADATVPPEVREKLEALLARMNAPGVRERMRAAFNATPEELGEAAVRVAKKAPPEDP